MPIAQAAAPLQRPAAVALASSLSDDVATMRAYLSGLRPLTVAEQLRLLRVAYPDAPLGDRVAACAAET